MESELLNKKLLKKVRERRRKTKCFFPPLLLRFLLLIFLIFLKVRFESRLKLEKKFFLLVLDTLLVIYAENNARKTTH